MFTELCWDIGRIRTQIRELQEELVAKERELWWLKRPHIFKFRITVDWGSDDQGGSSAYFRPRNTELNYGWIEDNKEVWTTYCNHNKKYPRPLEPDVDQLADDWDYYFRPVLDPEDWEYDYPNFEEFDEETMRNPNYAS